MMNAQLADTTPFPTNKMASATKAHVLTMYMYIVRALWVNY